jgi:hypothetical protein
MHEIPKEIVERWIMYFSKIPADRGKELLSGNAVATEAEKINIAVGTMYYINKRLISHWTPVEYPSTNIPTTALPAFIFLR